MFFKRRRQRRQAEDLFKLLRHAWKEVAPERFGSRTDAVLVLQPKLVTINVFCGRPDEERFSAASIQAIYEAVIRYEKAGLIETLMKTITTSQDIVLGALVSTCRREYELREKQNVPFTDLDQKIADATRRVIKCLNAVAKED
jgi:hypothetical protein